MLIAAIIDEKETILPITEGTTLRIYNTENKEVEDYTNPALALTEGRRGATLRFAEEKGATVFVAPPNTFCELSYKSAQADKVTFINIEPNTTFHSFEQALLKNEVVIQTTLPNEEILSS